MGLAFLDLIHRLYEPPEVDDGITMTTAASSFVLSEQVATALTTTAATAFLATEFGLGA